MRAQPTACHFINVEYAENTFGRENAKLVIAHYSQVKTVHVGLNGVEPPW